MPKKYIKFHKPFEVLCQFTDVQGRSTLKDFIPFQNIYSAGRLDYRSEGLLILTNDGPLTQRLTDPQYQHTKTYLVQVEGIASPEAIQALRTSIVVPRLQTIPAYAEIIPDPNLHPRSKPVRDYHPTSWIKIILQEGKKHQIRRMTAAVGLPTLRLVRFAIGEIQLENLPPGAWVNLSAAEIQALTHPAYPK